MQTIQTRITQLLGIERPIVQGGMMHVGRAELAAAVSQAGGLGIITALTQPSPEALTNEIKRCQSMTSKPFGVNITIFPTTNAPDYHAYAQAIIDCGVRIVETAGTPAVRPIWDQLLAANITIIHKCTSVRHALSAERYGVSAISIDGFECAGHPGEDDIPGLILIPAAADKVRIPLLASGGFADGRGLVAALALGADGINMGTRFCATTEAPIHDNIKQFLVANDERATNLIFRSLKNTARVAKTELSDEVVNRLAQPGASFENVADLVAGARGKVALESGDPNAGLVWAGMVQGLITDVPSCQALLDQVINDALSLIQQRLGKAVSG